MADERAGWATTAAKLSSMIESARSISSSDTVSGGRDAPHAVGPHVAHDVHRQAPGQALVCRPGAQFLGRLAGFAVRDELHAKEETAAAHFADQRVALSQFEEASPQAGAHCGRPLGQMFLRDHVEHRKAHRGGQGVAHMARDVNEAPFDDARLDLRADDRRREGQAAAQGLRDRHDVGDDAVLLEAEHRAEAAEASLCLVHDE